MIWTRGKRGTGGQITDRKPHIGDESLDTSVRDRDFGSEWESETVYDIADRHASTMREKRTVRSDCKALSQALGNGCINRDSVSKRGIT